MHHKIVVMFMNVGESQFTQSLKVRDLGVTFDQFRNFDDHITELVPLCTLDIGL